MLDVDLAVPTHAEVAGAVGAAVGAVRQRVMITVTQPTEGKFRGICRKARQILELWTKHWTKPVKRPNSWLHPALSAGANAVEVEITEQIKMVPLASNKDLFIEATIQAAATGTRNSRAASKNVLLHGIVLYGKGFKRP